MTAIAKSAKIHPAAKNCCGWLGRTYNMLLEKNWLFKMSWQSSGKNSHCDGNHFFFRPAATSNMTPFSISCNPLLMCFLNIPSIPIPDCLGDQDIDCTQPKRGCVSIPLRMQRAHHLLVAGQLSNRMQVKYGAVVREDPLWSSSV